MGRMLHESSLSLQDKTSESNRLIHKSVEHEYQGYTEASIENLLKHNHVKFVARFMWQPGSHDM